MSVRRLLRFFVKKVHPDIASTLPVTAKEINAKSLSILNSYVDILDQDVTDESSSSNNRGGNDPFVSKELTFFHPVRRFNFQQSGSSSSDATPFLPNRARLFRLSLPSLPPSASYHIKDQAAAQLISDAKTALFEVNQPQIYNLNSNTMPTSNSCKGAEHAVSLLKKNTTRQDFEQHWAREIHEAMFKDSLYDDPEEYKKCEILKVYRAKYSDQLHRKAVKIKNKKARLRRLAEVEQRTEEKIKEKFGVSHLLIQKSSGNVDVEDINTNSSESRNSDSEQGSDADLPFASTDSTLNQFSNFFGDDILSNKLRIDMIEDGYNPDLVFLHPQINADQRREAIRRCCGINLGVNTKKGPSSESMSMSSETESETLKSQTARFWLLKNLFKVMRQDPLVRIPLVLGNDQYYYVKNGAVYIPYNFELEQFAMLLENTIDEIREYHLKDGTDLNGRKSEQYYSLYNDNEKNDDNFKFVKAEITKQYIDLKCCDKYRVVSSYVEIRNMLTKNKSILESSII